MLMQLMALSGLLADELLMVNGDSLVVGQFNFSCKHDM